MSKRRASLGRGLDALLTSPSLEMTDPNKLSSENKNLEHRIIPISQIKRGKYQPRTVIDEEALQELADSIKAQGLIQPIVVRRIDDSSENYELVTGERRWRASQIAGLNEIPAIIRDVSDETAAAMSLIENIQREDLNAIETARALYRLINEFGLTHQQTAEAVGRSRTSVTNLIRLLDLEEEVKQLLYNKMLEMGHARALLSLQGKKQVEIARRVVSEALSVRQTEKLVSGILNKTQIEEKKIISEEKNPNIKNLEDDLAGKLGARVGIQHNEDGKGKLIIHYNSLEELDGILNHIK